jgi:hypothetical protein
MLIRVEPSLYEYVSFNIRTYYCVHERLIYYSNRDRIEFNQTEPSRVHERSSSSYTPSCKRADLEQISLVRARLIYVFHKLETSQETRFELGSPWCKPCVRSSSSSPISRDECLIEYLARLNSIKVKKK